MFVYVIMKVLKKCADANLTSFQMKYAVDRSLDDEMYETASIGHSLTRAMSYWTVRDKLKGVHKKLADMGIRKILVEENGLSFVGSYELT